MLCCLDCQFYVIVRVYSIADFGRVLTAAKLHVFFREKNIFFCLSLNFLDIMPEIRLRFSSHFSSVLSIYFLYRDDTLGTACTATAVPQFFRISSVLISLMTIRRCTPFNPHSCRNPNHFSQ